MDKYKLMDLIYDKLADNDEQEQIDHHEHTDNMAVVTDWQNGGQPLRALAYGDKEYVLSIKANDKNEGEFYD